MALLTLFARCISENCVKISNFNIYFHSFLWCLKKFYEGLEGFHNFFEASQRNEKIEI